MSLSRAAAGTTTNTATPTVSLFVVDPTGPHLGPSTTIKASVISVDPSLSQTTYFVDCPLTADPSGMGRPLSAPCDYLHGASVTANPSGMTLRLLRESQAISIEGPFADGRPSITTNIDITV